MFLSWEYFFSNAVIFSVFTIFTVVSLVILGLITLGIIAYCKLRNGGAAPDDGEDYVSVQSSRNPWR